MVYGSQPPSGRREGLAFSLIGKTLSKLPAGLPFHQLAGQLDFQGCCRLLFEDVKHDICTEASHVISRGMDCSQWRGSKRG